MVRPDDWTKLFDNADDEDFYRATLTRQKELCFMVESHRAYLLSRRVPTITGLAVLPTRETFGVEVLNDLVGLLIGVEGVLPAERFDPESGWTDVPVHKHTAVTDREAIWTVRPDLAVLADRDGFRLRVTGGDPSRLLTLRRPEAWMFVQALASARLWHLMTPDPCSSCGADMRPDMGGHTPTCGVPVVHPLWLRLRPRERDA